MIQYIIEELSAAIILLAITGLVAWAVIYPDHLQHTGVMAYNVISSLFNYFTSF